MSFCLCVYHVVRSAPWREGYEGLIFSKPPGLIAWLRESMARRNPPTRSASPQKVEERNFALFLFMFDAQEKPFQIKSTFETYIPRKRFTSSAETETILALGMPPTSLNTESNIMHSATASQDSSWVMTTFNAHCTAHCAVGDFCVYFANHDANANCAKSVRWRTELCAW